MIYLETCACLQIVDYTFRRQHVQDLLTHHDLRLRTADFLGWGSYGLSGLGLSGLGAGACAVLGLLLLKII